MDVKDPDNINNLSCMSYLEKKVEAFNANMNAAQKAGNRDLMKAWQQRWIQANGKKTVSTNHFKNCSVESYISCSVYNLIFLLILDY